MRALLVGLVAVTVAGCEGPPPITEIFVVIETDLSIPVEIDATEIEVQGLSGPPLGPFLTFLDPARQFHVDPPITLGVRGRTDPTAEFEVVARALRREGIVLEQHARARFVPTEVRTLCMRLDRACRGVACGAGLTCRLGTCTSVGVDPSTLGVYEGMPVECPPGVGSPDAGIADAGVLDARAVDGATP